MKVSVGSVLCHLAGVHSTIHAASTNHMRSDEVAINTEARADGLSYYVHLSLP